MSSTWFFSTEVPGGTFSDLTTPATFEVRLFCIFIASRITRTSPTSTVSPSFTSNCTTIPGIGAITECSPSRAGSGAEPDALSCFAFAARFVFFALRGRIGERRRGRLTAEDRFYRFVIEEALVYTGAKVVDSTIDCMKTDPLLGVIDARGAVEAPAAGMTIDETRSVVKLLKYHMKRERSKGSLERSTATLKKIHGLNLKKRLLIIRALGHTLGEAIYQSHYRGNLSTGEILELFRERIDEPGTAKGVYSAWTARTRPFRGSRGGWKTRG